MLPYLTNILRVIGEYMLRSSQSREYLQGLELRVHPAIWAHYIDLEK